MSANPAIGLRGLEGAVTTPEERAAIHAFRAAREKRMGETPKPSVDDMIGEVERSLCATEAGARAQFYLLGGVTAAAVESAIRLEAAMRALAWLKEKPVIAAIRQIEADRVADKARRAHFGAKKREAAGA